MNKSSRANIIINRVWTDPLKCHNHRKMSIFENINNVSNPITFWGAANSFREKSMDGVRQLKELTTDKYYSRKSYDHI